MRSARGPNAMIWSRRRSRYLSRKQVPQVALVFRIGRGGRSRNSVRKSTGAPKPDGDGGAEGGVDDGERGREPRLGIEQEHLRVSIGGGRRGTGKGEGGQMRAATTTPSSRMAHTLAHVAPDAYPQRAETPSVDDVDAARRPARRP